MYAQANASAAPGATETAGAENAEAKEKENVVDAEFEEVKEDKDKK
jgi:hypothetical protein